MIRESICKNSFPIHITNLNFEYFSYYVDPSTIQQSLSTAASVSHPTSTTASSLASSGFIGTTLTQRTHNSSHIARPSSTSSNTSPM